MAIVVGTVDGFGRRFLFKGIAGIADNSIVLETSDVSQFDEFIIMSSAGAMDILVSLDGSTFTTAPLSMADLGATSTAPVIVTAAGRLYGFRNSIKVIRVFQNGGVNIADCLMIAKILN